jgi:regulator of sigma E protease
MARRVGMKVETFSIGFGKPIFQWMRDGVSWQIGWILFGGYVKIAGQDLSNDQDPYATPDSFFSKSPWDRIKVAAMGPLVNLVFALLIFALLWLGGGREKSYSEYSSKLGWVDPKSELYAKGVRPGDQIISYDNKNLQSSKDHLYAAMMGDHTVEVKGEKVDYASKQKTPFDFSVSTYSHPASLDKDVLTTGVLQSANYVVYDRLPNGQDNPLPEGSPLQGSGLEYGDRLFWVDGELLFSSMQLNHILNDERVLLTIERNGKHLLARAPRVPVNELKLDNEVREELTDWQYAAELNHIRFGELYALPYNLNNQAVVESQVKFIDKENELQAFPEHPFSQLEAPLQAGDKIIAVHNKQITTSAQLLEQLQTNVVTIIVQRQPEDKKLSSWKESDQAFDQQIQWADLKKITDSIGTGHPVKEAGDLVLLDPVIPKNRSQIFLSAEKQAWANAEMLHEKKEVASIEDPEVRARAMAFLALKEKELMLGLPGVQDKKVSYNPTPLEMFSNVFDEIFRTLKALVTGSLNPKWMSGPIGIVQVVHDSAKSSLGDGLFWIGAISLNLGILNLLPIPVLDGGTIVLSLFEMITRRKISPKVLEKLVLPFAVLLIGLFVFLTFNDISRIFNSFFR